jgi:hypothetical protein
VYGGAIHQFRSTVGLYRSMGGRNTSAAQQTEAARMAATVIVHVPPQRQVGESQVAADIRQNLDEAQQEARRQGDHAERLEQILAAPTDRLSDVTDDHITPPLVETKNMLLQFWHMLCHSWSQSASASTPAFYVSPGPANNDFTGCWDCGGYGHRRGSNECRAPGELRALPQKLRAKWGVAGSTGAGGGAGAGAGRGAGNYKGKGKGKGQGRGKGAGDGAGAGASARAHVEQRAGSLMSLCLSLSRQAFS